MGTLKLFSGSSNPNLAEKIAKATGAPLGHCALKRFADGEVQIEIQENVRGDDVFVIQSTCPPVNESYMELFIIMDALKRASAARITAVIPYYGYARQDRKVAPRAPISAKCIADLLTSAGAHRILCVDLHSDQIQGFFNVPVDHLFAIPTFARAWHQKHGIGENYVVVSPDAGGVERVRAFAKRIDASIAIIDKRRTGPNEAKAFHLIGTVKDKYAIILDDMIDTAGTLIQAVDSLVENGAKQVFAIATHPVFSESAIVHLSNSQLEQVLVTDTIPLRPEAMACKKIRVISIAPVISEAIRRIHDNESVSSLFL